jgi:8-oxo-(d)GTP phosphatase
VIEAAGGVLWRRGSTGNEVEVTLVHRPKYDDWSVPKGKLNPGEHVLAGALREVREETGWCGVPGPPLGSIGYLKDGAPKRVRYWSMRTARGRFTPTAEVDRLMWLPPREALAHLDVGRDRCVVERFAEQPRPTRPVVLLRHATAEDREAWQGDDHDRPLDITGRRQADALAPLLAAYDVARAYTADVLRCIETIGALTTLRRIPALSEPLLSETGVVDNQASAQERLLAIAREPQPTVVCTQRAVLDRLLRPLLGELGERRSDMPSPRKGGFLVLHMATGSDVERVVSMECFEPPD